MKIHNSIMFQLSCSVVSLKLDFNTESINPTVKGVPRLLTKIISKGESSRKKNPIIK